MRQFTGDNFWQDRSLGGALLFKSQWLWYGGGSWQEENMSDERLDNRR